MRASLFLVLLLCGCVRLPGPHDALDQLVGQPELVLKKVMGVPKRTLEAEGHRYIVYEQRHPEAFAGYDMFDGYGRYGTLGYRRLGFEAYPEDYDRCETIFEIDQGRVAGLTMRGKFCG